MRGCLNLPERAGYKISDVLKQVSPKYPLGKGRYFGGIEYLQLAPNEIQLIEKFLV
jgi:hypothetical protein